MNNAKNLHISIYKNIFIYICIYLCMSINIYKYLKTEIFPQFFSKLFMLKISLSNELFYYKKNLQTESNDGEWSSIKVYEKN